MKLTTALLTLTLLTGVAAAAQDNKDDLFAGTSIFEKNATNVTEINQGPDQLGMVSGSHSSRAHGMLLNEVKSYEYDQPGQYNLADVDKFRTRLNAGDWHCSVHERNMKTGESSDICQKNRTDGYRESAIITVEKKELTFIHQITKEGDGGHSDVSFGNGVGYGFGAGMGAPMTIASAHMDAELAKMQAQLSAGMLPTGPMDLNLGDVTVKLDNLKVTPDVHVKLRSFPAAPEAPAPPAAPEPPAPAPAPSPVQ